MKIISFLIFVIIFAGACNNSKNKINTNIPSGINFKETVFDLGKIPNGSENKCIFEFLNTSKVPLIISDVIESCDCTSSKWPKKPVKPGKTGKIEVRYKAAGLGGVRKLCTVFSNAEDSIVHLYIKGEIIVKR